MLRKVTFEIARIQVPAKRRRTLDPARVEALAEDMLVNGQATPIQVRRDPKAAEEHYILIEGYHRLEALKALGEETIIGYLVQVRVH